MKVKKKTSLTTKYVALIGALLLVANFVLGIVLVNKNIAKTKDMIHSNVLTISKTAADILDGDALAAFTEADVNSELYYDIKNQLRIFKKNSDIIYIYTVKQISEDKYVFIVDEDPVAPGQYGEEVVITYALQQAAKGISAFDDTAYTDKWGTYYSSYSPVYDSYGNIACVVGVDFDTKAYDMQIRESTRSIVIISVLFVVFGLICVILINRQVEQRFSKLHNELTNLSTDVDELNSELKTASKFSDHSEDEAEHEGRREKSMDEIEELSNNIRMMHGELKRYIEYTHIKSSTDALTQVKNSSAYFEKQVEITESINDGTASFAVAVFDINYLKQTNDIYGHSVGDKNIQESAMLIAEVFSPASTFRIGGDEFAVIADNMTLEEMNEKLVLLAANIESHNRRVNIKGTEVSISYGSSAFEPLKDTTYKEVFIRADRMMYDRKVEFHNKRSD